MKIVITNKFSKKKKKSKGCECRYCAMHLRPTGMTGSCWEDMAVEKSVIGVHLRRVVFPSSFFCLFGMASKSTSSCGPIGFHLRCDLLSKPQMQLANHHNHLLSPFRDFAWTKSTRTNQKLDGAPSETTAYPRFVRASRMVGPSCPSAAAAGSSRSAETERPCCNPALRRRWGLAMENLRLCSSARYVC